MSSGPLAGHGILVTRPEQQADDLSAAIEAQGGRALCFPLLEIESRERAAIARDESQLPRPDLVIYVSPNAVRHGFDWHPANALVAAIGPATQAGLMARGATGIISGSAGFDSENLLAHETMSRVRGKNIRIVRGQDGRELLGTVLRERGANVDYLAVYLRRARRVCDADRLQLERHLRSGEISCVTVMSVATLTGLFDVLPGERRDLLRHTRLVTPSLRVLKTITEQMPELAVTLAPGPQADDMILGLIACLKQDNTE
jgi:uroporphyrinogen-III synthase